MMVNRPYHSRAKIPITAVDARGSRPHHIYPFRVTFLLVSPTITEPRLDRQKQQHQQHQQKQSLSYIEHTIDSLRPAYRLRCCPFARRFVTSRARTLSQLRDGYAGEGTLPPDPRVSRKAGGIIQASSIDGIPSPMRYRLHRYLRKRMSRAR